MANIFRVVQGMNKAGFNCYVPIGMVWEYTCVSMICLDDKYLCVIYLRTVQFEIYTYGIREVLNDLTFLHRQVWLRAIPAGEDDNSYKTPILCKFILVFILFLSQFKQYIKIKYNDFNYDFTILVCFYAN